MRILIFLLILPFSLFSQGVEPSQIQYSTFKNGILKATIPIYDEFEQDTVYYYEHVDSVFIGDVIDSVTYQNDSLFIFTNKTDFSVQIISLTDSVVQKIDTFQVFDTNKLRISISGDNEPAKVVTLPTGGGSIIDSTIVVAGFGITVTESPLNTFTVKSDTSKMATQYDLTLLDPSITNEIQTIDTFQVYDTNKLRISLSNDGQAAKFVTLPSGSGGITGSGVADRVTIWDGINSVTSNANFTFTGGNSVNIIGRMVMQATATAGNWNAFINGGNTTLTGIRNVAIGSNQTLSSLTTGNSNLAFGTLAGNKTSTGSENVFLGYLTGAENTTGNDNMYIGSGAGYLNNGAYNTFIGTNSGRNCLTTIGNIFLGFNTGYNNNNNFNIGIGYYNSFNSTNTGTENVIIGTQASQNGGGNYNIKIGTQSGYANTGSNNVFIGQEAGFSTSSKGGNIFIGYEAGRNEDIDNSLIISNSSSLSNGIYGDYDNAKFGVNIAPASATRAWDINGELRVRDLTTDNPTRLIGADNDGDINSVTIGSGLSITGSTLNVNSFIDSTIVTQGFGILVNESPLNTFTVRADTSKIATQFDISQLDQSATNEIQTLSTSGAAGNISISAGNTITLNVNDADASPTNELQTITTNGSAGNITLSNTGGTLNLNVNDADASPTNEIQTLSHVSTSNSHVVSLSNSGGSLTLIEGTGINLTTSSSNVTINATQNISTDGSAGNITITGGSTLNLNVNDADANPTNELQKIDTFQIFDTNKLRISLQNDAEAAKVVTLPNTIDSTNVTQGYGIIVAESPANTFTVSSDTSKIATLYDVSIVDQSATNELQTISTSGAAGNITLSNGGGTLNINVNDADSSPTNEIQNISTNGTAGNITISSGSTLTLNVNDADASITNEIQTIDTFQIFDTNKLRISLTQDNQPAKVVTLPTGGGGGIDSTIINGGWGVDVVESPLNTFTVKADTAEVATQFDISNFVSGSGTATRPAFWTASKTLSSDSNFEWDNTNKKLSLGTGFLETSFRLHVGGNPASTTALATFEHSGTTNGSAILNLSHTQTASNQIFTVKSDGFTSGNLMNEQKNNDTGIGNSLYRALVSGTGDSYMNYGRVSGINWSLGMKQSDSYGGRFTLSYSSNLASANEMFSMSTSGYARIKSLSTSLFSPPTSGTTRMVITDANGDLSFANIPTSGVSGTGTVNYMTYWNTGTTIAGTAIAYGTSFVGLGFGVAPASVTHALHINNDALRLQGSATIIDKNNSGGANGHVLSGTGGAGVQWRSLSDLGADISNTNEIQSLSTTGAAGNISISSGNTITLNVNDADASITNELQALSHSSTATNHTMTLSSGGGSLILAEGSGISLTTASNQVTIAATSSATDLSFSGTSSPVTLNSSSGTDVTLTAGSGISLAATSGNTTITASDASATNEAQTMTYSLGTLSLSQVSGVGGGNILLPSVIVGELSRNANLTGQTLDATSRKIDFNDGYESGTDSDPINDQILINYAGFYKIEFNGSYQLSTNYGSGVKILVYKNGSPIGYKGESVTKESDGTADNITAFSKSFIAQLAIGDIITLYYVKNTGSNSTISFNNISLILQRTI